MEDRRFRLDLPGQAQVDGHVSVDAHDDFAGGHISGGGRAGQHDGFAHGIAQRRDPEVVLQLGQREGERLGDRAGAVDRTARHAADLRGDRARLQQPHSGVGVDRPLDVLGPSVHVGDLRRQLDETTEIGRWELRSVVGREVDDLAVGRIEHVARAVDLSTDQSLRPAGHGAHDAAVGAPGHRVDPEHHPAVRRLDERLDEHGDGVFGSAGPLPGVEHRRHGVGEGVEAGDADDRLELPGHRRRRHVLDHRRTAGDQCPSVAAGPFERFVDGGMRANVSTGIAGIGERRGQHDAREAGQAGDAAACQGGRLATGERSIDGGGVSEVDDERALGACILCDGAHHSFTHGGHLL